MGKNLNFINPSCYLNPEDNNCEKDFFFKINDKQKLENFLNYKPFAFKQLKIQILFNYLSLIFLMICVVYIIIYLGLKIKKNPFKNLKRGFFKKLKINYFNWNTLPLYSFVEPAVPSSV